VPVDPGTDSRHAVRRTALAFTDAITRRDLVALGGLMTDDHTDNNVFSGREDVLNAWRGSSRRPRLPERLDGSHGES
jgi:ketosteroid isomerase-like protein